MKRILSILAVVILLVAVVFLYWERTLGIMSRATTIIFTGDVMLGRTVMTTSLYKGDPTYPFAKVAQKLKSADLTVINLENPIVPNCPRHYTGFKFCTDPAMVGSLNYAGVDIANLANNHSKNYGANGLSSTENILQQNNINYTGVGNLVIREINGVKFGFVGLDKAQIGLPKLTSSEESFINDSDKKVDVLIVSIHWGVEYQDKASEGQRALAKTLVEMGADVIVGHHPHWVQNMEYINGKPVYYSLGNFVFDQMWSTQTREGLAMKLTFDGSKLINEEKMPIYMVNHAQPEWASTLNK